jgi:hypothetical protein
VKFYSFPVFYNPRSLRVLDVIFFGRLHPANDVRFTPESGHVRCSQGCPLWAISGHWHAIRSSRRRALALPQAHVEAERLGRLQIDVRLWWPAGLAGRRVFRP